MKNSKRHIFRKIWVAGLAVILLSGWLAWGNTALMVSEVTVASHRLPAAFSGFRIAQVSDLHNAEFGENNELLLQCIADSRPDIVVLTGDLIDSRRTDINVALEFAAEAVQIAPVYFVTGNHEARIAEYDDLKAGLEASGATVLEDTSVSLERGGETVTLIGVSDPAFSSGETMFQTSTAGFAEQLATLCAETDNYTILLSHRPELFDVYADCDVDVVFSGHAHGGQFRMPLIGGLIAPGQGFFPAYDAGLYVEEDTNMIVSRGIGNSLFPLRVNNRPELVVVELQSKEKSWDKTII